MLRKFHPSSPLSSSRLLTDCARLNVNPQTIRFSEGILFHLKELLEAMNQRKKNESVSTSRLMKFIEK
jgi:hypothetical protein